MTLDLVRRAEKAGYKALAVTVDTPVLGRREADIRNKFSLPSHLTMGKTSCPILTNIVPEHVFSSIKYVYRIFCRDLPHLITVSI